MNFYVATHLLYEFHNLREVDKMIDQFFVHGDSIGDYIFFQIL